MKRIPQKNGGETMDVFCMSSHELKNNKHVNFTSGAVIYVWETDKSIQSNLQELTNVGEIKRMTISTIDSLGMTCHQLFYFLDFIQEKQIKLSVLKESKAELFENEYLNIIYQLSMNERKIMSSATKAGIKRAREQGVLLGRPSVDNKTIQKVVKMKAEGFSYRVISLELGISIGTISKYLKKVESP